MVQLKKNLPALGFGLYVLVYLYAAYLYPGGSQKNAQSPGFDWVHNYWCNLLNETAINGNFNPARPFAIFGNFILAATIAFFFWDYPTHTHLGTTWSRMIQYSGLASMVFAMLLFSSYHDQVSIASGVCGVIALLGVFRGLILNKARWLIKIGVGCIFFIVVNNIIYFSTVGLSMLPVIQKVTLLFIFIWILLIHRLRVKEFIP